MSLTEQLRDLIPERCAEDVGALLGMSGYEVERKTIARINGGIIPAYAQWALARERGLSPDMALEKLTEQEFTVGYNRETVVPAHVRDTIDAIVADIRTVALSRVNTPYEPEHYIDTKLVPTIEARPDKEGNYEATIVMYGKQISAWIGHASPQKYGNAYFPIKAQMQKLLDKMREQYKTKELHKKIAKKHAEHEKKKQGKLF